MSSKGIIHIIDDDPVIHDVLAQLLTSEGYEVEISGSGEEALEKFPSRSFDVILLAGEKALERKRLQDENLRLKDELRQRFGFANIIGKSEAMRNVFELVKAAPRRRAPSSPKARAAPARGPSRAPWP